ncbi:putative ribonuclease H-like domain-containing protein [Senna tora]|uniref:Putative ribonuclease H-like domain-containing protein n=1 Tax=Senna tora TaxID=362788 RepID=A0A834WND2_9FABA|nr:putative ribonuclease H-like domain-containing protein [Senna tora]
MDLQLTIRHSKKPYLRRETPKAQLWQQWNKSQIIKIHRTASNGSAPEKKKSLVARDAEFTFLSPNPIIRNGLVPIVLRWEPPALGWFKLNVDGSCLGPNSYIAAAGVIRNDNGNWVNGIAQFCGIGTSIQAELWGLYIGLIKAKELGIQLIEVECDCKAVVNFMSCSNISDAHPLAPLIYMCRSFLPQFSQCIVRHIYREKNSCTDLLAKHAAARKLPFTLYDVVSSFLFSVFWADLLGISSRRRISTNIEPG